MALTKVNNRMIDGSYLNVKDFGAKGDPSATTVAAETAAIQDAINYASNNDIQTIFFPDGHYKYSVLRTYYHPTDNSGYSQDISDGRLVFRGTGRMAITDLEAYDGTSTGSNNSADKRLTGAVLESTGAGLIVDPTNQQGAAGGNYGNARNFVAKDITFVANNTGQIIEAKSCPGLTFDHCSFKQLGTGGAILARNCWFFTLNQSYLVGEGSGDGISSEFLDARDGSGNPIVESGDFAGLWTVTNSLIESFDNGIHWTGGKVVNFAIRDSAIQDSDSYGILADIKTDSNGNDLPSQIQQMTLDNVYFEAISLTGTSFIKSSGESIQKLYMQSCYMLGGGNNSGAATSKLTGPHIDLDRPQSVDINNTVVFRPPTKFLHIENETSGNAHNFTGQVRNTAFVHDATNFSAITTPVYLVTTGTSVSLPFLENNIISGNPGINNTTASFQLYNSSTEEVPPSIDVRTGSYSIPKLGLGNVTSEVLPSPSIEIAPGSSNIRQFEAQFSGRKVLLDNSDVVPNGRMFFVKSADNSAQNFTVELKNSPSTVLATLTPGESAIFAHSVSGNSYTYVMLGKFTIGSSVFLPAGTLSACSLQMNDSNTGLYSPLANQFAAVSNGTEAFRINSSANTLFHTTNEDPVGVNDSGCSILNNGRIKLHCTSGNDPLVVGTNTQSTGVSFWYHNGSSVSKRGNISITANGVSYLSLSDERAKESIVDAPSSSSDIDAIQVRSFDWKADGSHQKYGMIAQELQDVAPDAVSAGANPEELMGVDYAKLVPMMIKEIQLLRARVAEMEASS